MGSLTANQFPAEDLASNEVERRTVYRKEGPRRQEASWKEKPRRKGALKAPRLLDGKAPQPRIPYEEGGAFPPTEADASCEEGPQEGGA